MKGSARRYGSEMGGSWGVMGVGRGEEVGERGVDDEFV